jgi:hypothetical protein
MADVTVVITPRDRYTGIEKCIANVYRCTPEPFKLLVVDAGYPASLRQGMERAVRGRANAEIVDLGRVIPMEAMAAVRSGIDTPYVMHLDNDSDVTPGWLPPLLETAGETGAAIINPLTLERAGVDDGEDLRCHLYTSDIRVVSVEGTPYLIENKHFRRTAHRDLPTEVRETETFELHGVMFETAALREIDIPRMTIREHIDISMQMRAMGRIQVVDPRSIVEFDNLGTRAALHDLRYFNHRWNAEIMRESSELFLERWGYRFYSEQFMYNWAVRRRLFLVLHHFHCPMSVANKLANGYQKFFLPKWEPLADPTGASEHFYSTLEGGLPVRRDREVSSAV